MKRRDFIKLIVAARMVSLADGCLSGTATTSLSKAMNVKSVFNKVFFDAQKGISLDGEKAEHVSLHVNMTAHVEIPLPEGKGEVIVDNEVVPSKKVRSFAIVENVGSGIHTFRTTEVVRVQVKQEI
jgi:hypothetical protein